MSMDTKEEELRELLHTVYNAEDMIDGCFNEEEYLDIPDIVNAYTALLGGLNEFMVKIDNTLKTHTFKDSVITPKACSNKNPDDMCGHCTCWKSARAYSS